MLQVVDPRDVWHHLLVPRAVPTFQEMMSSMLSKLETSWKWIDEDIQLEETTTESPSTGLATA